MAVALMLSACSLNRKADDPGTTPRTDRSFLVQSQMTDHRFVTAYDAVESLRANWLRTRGADSFQNPSHVRVYLDNVSLGGVENLRSIVLTNVVYMRFYDAAAATSRWGLDHGSGAIYVSTRPLVANP
jgi:hypothetical protein